MRCYVEANDLAKAEKLVAKTIDLVKELNNTQ